MNNTSNKQAYMPEDTEVNLLALFHQILEHKCLTALIMLFALTIGILYSSRQVPEYQSDLLLQIEARHPGILNVSAGDPPSTQIALIRSRFVLEPVIKSLGLDISISPAQRSIWKRIYSSERSSARVKLFEVPHRYINKPLNLVLDKPAHYSLYNSSQDLLLEGAVGSLVTNKDKTIRLQIDSITAPIGTHFSLVKQSPVAAARSVQSQMSLLESMPGTGILNLSLVGSDPHHVIKILNAIGNVAQSKDAQKKSLEASQTLDFLYQQLPLTKGLLEKAESKLNDYRAKSGKINYEMQTQYLLSQLLEINKRLADLRNHKVEMLQQYTASHPAMHAVEAQISTLAKDREQLSRRVKKLPATDQIAVNFALDVGVKKSLYLILLNKIQELKVTKAGTISSIRILAYATLPDGPLPENKALIYLASLVAGFVLSIIFIFGRKLFSPRVDDPSWGERKYNLANLAIIPYCKEQAKNSLNFISHTSKEVALLAHTNPRNLSIESLRSLRTSLQVLLPSARNNIISILGVSPGVGKSFVSSNLAYLLATSGKRVVLIDGDLRRGTLHKYFNIPAVPGMAEILNGKVSLSEGLNKSMHPNLTFIPRGTYPANPSEVLMSEQFRLTINTLSEQFDVVVIDTAPVLLVTDAVVIGALAGTNFLVLGAGAHQPTEIEMVLKRLASSEINVQGTIFNFHRAATITQSYGSYSKYGKYNKYYYDDTINTK